MKHTHLGHLIVSQHAGKATVFLHGVFSLADKTSEKFDAALTKLETAGVKKATVKINSGGGSVVEGIKMYRRAEASTIEITKEVVGVAASMAAAFAAGGVIERNSKMMFHKPFLPSLATSVGAADLRDIATMLDDFEADMVAMVVNSTKLPETDVRAKYFVQGQDVWQSAKQAVEAGIMKGYVGEVPSATLPMNFMELDAVASFEVAKKAFRKEYKQLNIMEDELEVQAVAKELGMTAGVKATEVLAELKALVGLKKENEGLKLKVEALETAVKTEREAKAVKLVADAVASGKILASEKDQFEADAKANYDFVARMMDRIPAKVDLSKLAGGASASTEPSKKDWDYNKWCDEDPQGLRDMKKTDPEKYSALITAYTK